MTEADARNALLVRAFEMPLAAPWTEADREWASAEAARLAGEQAEPQRLIATRATLAAVRLTQRDAGIAAVVAACSPHAGLGAAVLLIAAAVGLAIDAIGPTDRINILAPPLLALIAWNLVVYAAMALRALSRRSSPGLFRQLGALALHQLIARTLHRIAPDRQGAHARFAAAWAGASRELTLARIAMLLHLAAAALALGALNSLYLRGLAFEYRAGWDSTFLDAATVQHLLSVVLAPASTLTGVPLPDAAQLDALRFSSGVGENAAGWIHLYAVTVGLFVLLPRGVLAGVAAWRARQWKREFPLPLQQAYFQHLVRAQSGTPVAVCVLPYSYHLSPDAAAGLCDVTDYAFGPRTELTLAPAVALGAEDEIDALLPASARSAAVVLPLFALSSTPERENHGAFVHALASRCAAHARFIVLVDESGFRLRFGAAEHATRLAQRRHAWQRMLQDLGHTPVFVDLSAPDLDTAEAALNAPAAETSNA